MEPRRHGRLPLRPYTPPPLPLLTGVLGVVPFIVLFDIQGCAPHAFAADLFTNAGAKTTGEPLFIYFVVYYGSDDYACRWVEAVFAGSAIGFDNGNADFSLYGILGRLQGIKKGTAYMHILMYAIHKMESAVGKCEAGSVDGNAAALHAWDEGVVSSRCWTVISRTGRS